jgi:hypothetical protein
MIFWVGFYLTGRTQRVRLGNNLSETIYCYFGVTQGSHIGPLFLIADINDVLDSFEIFAHSLAFFSYPPFFQCPASFFQHVVSVFQSLVSLFEILFGQSFLQVVWRVYLSS